MHRRAVSEHAFDAIPVADGVIYSVGRLLAPLPAHALNLAYRSAVVTGPGNFMAPTPLVQGLFAVAPWFRS